MLAFTLATSRAGLRGNLSQKSWALRIEHAAQRRLINKRCRNDSFTTSAATLDTALPFKI